MGYLVIHVHEDCGVQRGGGQARVVWFAEREADVRQLHELGSLGELDEEIPRDVLSNNRAGGSDEVREPDRVVAIACTNVANGHARLQFKQTGDLTGFIQAVAVLFGSAAWVDNLRNRAPR